MYTNDLVLCKFGKYFDYLEIEPSSDYIVDVIEPFLDLKLRKEDKLGKQKLYFTDDRGTRHEARVADIITSGLKVYYHDKERVDVNKYPGTRATGMLGNLLGEIELVVDKLERE